MAQTKHSNKQTQTSKTTKTPEKQQASAPVRETWQQEMLARKRKERELAMKGMDEQQQKDYLVDQLMKTDHLSNVGR